MKKAKWPDYDNGVMSEVVPQRGAHLSGSSAQFLECRAFKTVEVAFAGRRLLKNMLSHFKRRYRLSD